MKCGNRSSNSSKSFGTTNPSCPTNRPSLTVNGSACLFSTEKLTKVTGWFSAIAVLLSIETPLSKGVNFMPASVRKGRDELAARVQQGLAVHTKTEAEHTVDAGIGGLEATLLKIRGPD